MTMYAYRLRNLLLSGWIDHRTLIDQIFRIAPDQHVAPFREELARRVELAGDLFDEMGLVDPDLSGTIWFAALPDKHAPRFDSDYMFAIVTDTEAYVASPTEVCEFAESALDTRRTEFPARPALLMN